MPGGNRDKLLSFRYRQVRCDRLHRAGLRLRMMPVISSSGQWDFLPAATSSGHIIVCALRVLLDSYLSFSLSLRDDLDMGGPEKEGINIMTDSVPFVLIPDDQQERSLSSKLWPLPFAHGCAKGQNEQALFFLSCPPDIQIANLV